ncbi:diacylglycerol kinase catalytic region [Kribbella flavida DSM 17836]|uniref:Diacylglycerol kinase catalytic region n=1 Tax=Kribbella flavida (strain DSM 17836 / JCM 10339 / NBRC 14399) TaxID=479435 RepID=D2PZ43_KRIFD|nr:diacylglycerol kinase family protein [Kribbella flavida]ADB31837.1 diacylglycerol kinase catalytic region [Kribbella flavida DSM 17836]
MNSSGHPDPRDDQPEPPALRRAAVILNPIKVPDADEFRKKVDAALSERGYDDSLWLETTVDDAGYTMAQRAVEETVDLVVVAGGDGTVRVVCAELARTGIPVAVLPAGTGNLLARNLGITLDLDAALAELLDGSERRIDSVLVRGDQFETDRFVVMAGLGLDAAIIADARPELKARVGWAAYVISAVKNLNHPFVRVEITLDDRPPLRRRARTVVIGNVGTLQANIPLLPDAEPDDGRIDLVVLAPRRVRQWPRLALSLLIKSWRESHIERFTAERIQVTSRKVVGRQLDGDTIPDGHTLSAEVDPSALVVRVP